MSTSTDRPEIRTAVAPFVRYGGPGYGWFVLGPGVIAGVSQTVRLAGPFTTASAAQERADELAREYVAQAARHSVKVTRLLGERSSA